MSSNRIRRGIYRQLEPRARSGPGLSLANRIIVLLILGSVLLAVLETEASFHDDWPAICSALEVVFGVVFSVEYLLRVWIAPEDARYADGLRGRLRYMMSAAAILDLAALLPAILLAVGSESFLLRAARLLRIFRLARLGRFSSAMTLMSTAVRSRRHELILSVGIAGVLVVLSSTLLFLAEQGAQPDSFGSIPRAMWWSISALTTVGYGDVYPITVLGRCFAALTSILGIGLIAMPTGILAAAFSEAIQTARREGAQESVEQGIQDAPDVDRS